MLALPAVSKILFSDESMEASVWKISDESMTHTTLEVWARRAGSVGDLLHCLVGDVFEC